MSRGLEKDLNFIMKAKKSLIVSDYFDDDLYFGEILENEKDKKLKQLIVDK